MSDAFSDDRVKDYILNDCNLSIDDLKLYLEKEKDIRDLSHIGVFLSNEEVDQLFRVMRDIVEGRDSFNPYDSYDRAMSIL